MVHRPRSERVTAPPTGRTAHPGEPAPGDRALSDACAPSVRADDGHHWSLLARVPAAPRATLLWLPALGVAARHYLPFAEALAAHGVAVFVHEWRGHGTSSLRASRAQDWGYRELLTTDIPASEAAIVARVPGVERIVGGHSLGGQLASCYAGLSAHDVHRLWLVASGAPYWRSFPAPVRWGLPLAYRFLPWLAERVGALPGRRIGFGGNEARGLIRDWARTGITGRYAARGLEADLERALAASPLETHAVVMADDWLAPPSSLRFLLAKLAASHVSTDILTEAQLGAPADHFHWLNQPQAVVETLVARSREQRDRPSADAGRC